MKRFVLMLLVMLLPTVGFAQGWQDASDGTHHTTGDKWPIPVRQGLVWSGTINVVAEQCDADTDGTADNYTRLEAIEVVDKFLTDDGGSFVDDTTDAGDAGTGDVQPWPSTIAVDDAWYMGDADRFNLMEFVISTQGSTVITVVWEYSVANDTWRTMTFNVQEVVDFDEAVGTYVNDWEIPADWTTTTVNSTSAYWVRARVTARTSDTTDALLTTAKIGKANGGEAHQLLIVADSGETESIWCDVDNAPDVDEAVEFTSSPRQSFTVEINHNANEVVCCSEGGTSKLQVLLMSDGNGARKVE